ncbi:hypothetical protein DL767_004618 [Monosporascus sp. MG133]|nr:hypothetical protein DL767_004618 [Monosporascus sp. MG133]
MLSVQVNCMPQEPVVTNTTTVQPNFMESYNAFRPQDYNANNTLGGRLTPRSLVQENLPVLMADMRTMAENGSAVGQWQINGITANVAHLRIGNPPASNAVLHAERDSLFQMNFGVGSQKRPTGTQCVEACEFSWGVLDAMVHSPGSAPCERSTVIRADAGMERRMVSCYRRILPRPRSRVFLALTADYEDFGRTVQLGGYGAELDDYYVSGRKGWKKLWPSTSGKAFGGARFPLYAKRGYAMNKGVL